METPKLAEQNSSRYALYAIGIVAEDKIKDEHTIKVYVKELIGDYTGNINESRNISGMSEDSDGKVFNVNVDINVTVPAVWYSRNTNRVTPPNVRAGMKVELYKYGNTDKYYWSTQNYESDLIGLEHVMHIYSNTNELPSRKLNRLNTYWSTVSTRDKYVWWHTSNNDGEPSTYDILFDTKNASVILVDKNKNFIELKSLFNRWRVVSQNSVELHAKQEITLSAPKINLNAGKVYINAELYNAGTIHCPTVKSGVLHGALKGPLPYSGSIGPSTLPNPETDYKITSSL